MTEQNESDRRPRRFGRWMAAGAAMVLGLELLAQAIILFRGPRPADDLTRLYRPHPYRVYMLVAGARSARGDISVNSHGFRGPEIDLIKPQNTVRIACLGGSTTFGDTATTDAHTFPAHLERALREHYTGANAARIEVINAGLPGYTSLESLIYFESRLLDYQLDLAVFQHALNDAVFLANFADFAGDYTHARTVFRLPRIPLWKRSALARLLLPAGLGEGRSPNRATALALARLTLTDPDRLELDEAEQRKCFRPERLDVFERNLRNFIYVAQGHGVTPVLSTETCDPRAGFFAEVVEQLNERIRETAESHSVPLIDFARAMPWNADAFVDVCHLRDGPDGLERKGKVFAEALIRQTLIDKRLGKVRDGNPRP